MQTYIRCSWVYFSNNFITLHTFSVYLQYNDLKIKAYFTNLFPIVIEEKIFKKR